jgi:hypothetical protein
MTGAEVLLGEGGGVEGPPHAVAISSSASAAVTGRIRRMITFSLA